MAGRNWTRKSIEELVKAYLNKHGGGKTITKLLPSIAYAANTGMSNIDLGIIVSPGTSSHTATQIPQNWLGDKMYLSNPLNYGDIFIRMKGVLTYLANDFKTGYFATEYQPSITGLEYIYFFHDSTVTRINVTSTTSNQLQLVSDFLRVKSTSSSSALPDVTVIITQIYSARIAGTTDVIDFLLNSEYASVNGTWLFCNEELTEDDLLTSVYTTYEEVTL